jgi:hypothetical protein
VDAIHYVEFDADGGSANHRCRIPSGRIHGDKEPSIHHVRLSKWVSACVDWYKGQNQDSSLSVEWNRKVSCRMVRPWVSSSKLPPTLTLQLKIAGSYIRFNNATQRIFGGVVSPIVYVWETNDPLNPWCAEARRMYRCLSNLSRRALTSTPLQLSVAKML